MKKWLYSALLFVVWASLAYGEKITHFAVNVTVEQSGELAITETIEYDFETQSKHGIFRDIPFTIKRASQLTDLGLHDFSVRLDDDMVEWKQSTERSNLTGEIIRLKIGSANTFVTGKHLYTLHYRVKKGVLPAFQNEANDAIRWNIVGTGWQIPIHNIKANFFLPLTLSQQNSTVATFTGDYGSTNSGATYTWLSPNHLEASVSSLQPHEGATVEIAYPAYTLEQNGLSNVRPSFMERLLGNFHWAALLGFLYYFRKKYKEHTGFEDERAVAVQYEPPKGLSLLQSALLVDKFANSEDVAAAVLELAHLGHLEIDQQDKKLDPILIRKETDTQTLTQEQRYLLEQVLFKSGTTFVMSSGSDTKASALQDGFSKISETLYLWSVEQGYMSENPQRVRRTFLTKSLVALALFVALTFYTLYLNNGEQAVLLLLFPFLFGAAGLGAVVTGKNWVAKLSGVAFVAMGFAPVFGMSELKEQLLMPAIVLVIISAALFFTYKKLGKFTQKGAATSKHILGLKAFIKRVKKDELKRRLALDPLYLEKMLPYAVLFGETEHWLSFYDLLQQEEPHWYHGNLSTVSHLSSAFQSASTPPSQSSSDSGSFGGGGFSGGGGGGGGGGSW